MTSSQGGLLEGRFCKAWPVFHMVVLWCLGASVLPIFCGETAQYWWHLVVPRHEALGETGWCTNSN